MPDVVRKNENHHVIKPIIMFIFRNYLHVSFICMLAMVLLRCIVVVFLLLLVSDGHEFCSNRNLNVKPSEYYDYFFRSSCERWIKIGPNSNRDKMSLGHAQICICFVFDSKYHFHCVTLTTCVSWIHVWISRIYSYVHVFNGYQKPNY